MLELPLCILRDLPQCVQFGTMEDHDLKAHIDHLSCMFYTLTLFSIVDSMVNLQSKAMQKNKTKNPKAKQQQQKTSFTSHTFKSIIVQMSESTYPKEFLYYQLLQKMRWVYHCVFWLQDLVLQPLFFL